MRQTRERVLLVEDDPDVAEITVGCLESFFQVEHAADGEQALNELRTTAPHSLPKAIIFDLSMPRMTGFEFREAIAREARLQRIPLLTLTAFSRTPELDHRLKVDALLVKPVELPVLVDTVKRLCDRWYQLNDVENACEL